MTRWEYAVTDNPQLLNEWGAQGWELVAVTQANGAERFYFKRPLPSLREQITLEQREQALRSRKNGGSADRKTGGAGEGGTP